MTSRSRVTLVLEDVASGRSRRASDILPDVYSELRSLARAMMVRVPPGNTLQPTALVHEAYVRLAESACTDWKCREYFFSAAAQAMRQILVEQARRKGRKKHGGGHERALVDVDDIALDTNSVDALALDEGLERLEAAEPRAAHVVMLRYFAGLTVAETADAMGVSISTIEREWRSARVLLRTMIGDAS